MWALPHRDVAAAIQAVEVSGGPALVKLASTSGAHCSALRRDLRAECDEIRHGGSRVDRPGDADQGEARARHAVVPAAKSSRRRCPRHSRNKVEAACARVGPVRVRWRLMDNGADYLGRDARTPADDHPS